MREENKIGDKIKKCSWENCELEGEYRAPKSKSQIRVYYYFCIEHVRIYNNSWNYYEGMSDQDVENLVTLTKYSGTFRSSFSFSKKFFNVIGFASIPL